MTHLPNKLILIRHGKTGSNKKNPNRPLTEFGIKQIEKTAKRLIPVIIKKDCLIVSANNLRAVQSALIISKIIKVAISPDLADLDIGNIQDLGNTNNQRFKKYNDLFIKKALPKSVKLPEKLLKKFYSEIGISDAMQIVFVGNGGVLDVILKYQSSYKVDKKIKRLLFNYGEYVILSKK